MLRITPREAFSDDGEPQRDGGDALQQPQLPEPHDGDGCGGDLLWTEVSFAISVVTATSEATGSTDGVGLLTRTEAATGYDDVVRRPWVRY